MVGGWWTISVVKVSYYQNAYRGRWWEGRSRREKKYKKLKQWLKDTGYSVPLPDFHFYTLLTIFQIACILMWLLLLFDLHSYLAPTSACYLRFSCFEMVWVVYRKNEQVSNILGWKVRFLRYREWHMEKLNGWVLRLDGRHSFWDIVSGIWENWTGEYCIRIESTVLRYRAFLPGFYSYSISTLAWLLFLCATHDFLESVYSTSPLLLPDFYFCGFRI